jgi:radical SAM enzyme (rSAM/lipoprotein system)
MLLNKTVHYFHDQFRTNETHIHELNYLFWECTWRCNLKCLHCGSDCVADSKISDMPFDDFLRAILPLKNVYKQDSITVVITGGEPLLRNDLPECGKILRKHGFRWGIVTNGYAYNQDIHARLLAAGMGAITLSLDGFEDTHNWLRVNKKSHENALHALELITASNRLFYDVVTCVNRKNVNDLSAFKEFLISKNVKAWRLFTIAPIGRAANNENMHLTSQELKQLMDFISRSRSCSDKRIDVKFSCEAYVGQYEKKVRDSYFFCRAGINIASILIDGSISACPNINRHFVQGNIYRDNFLAVWNNRFDIMRNRSWTKTGICFDCKEYKHCNGGAMHLWNEKQDSIMTCVHRKIKKKHETEQ